MLDGFLVTANNEEYSLLLIGNRRCLRKTTEYKVDWKNHESDTPGAYAIVSAGSRLSVQVEAGCGGDQGKGIQLWKPDVDQDKT